MKASNKIGFVILLSATIATDEGECFEEIANSSFHKQYLKPYSTRIHDSLQLGRQRGLKTYQNGNNSAILAETRTPERKKTH